MIRFTSESDDLLHQKLFPPLPPLAPNATFLFLLAPVWPRAWRGTHTHVISWQSVTELRASPPPPPLFSPDLRRIENDWKQFPSWTISGARSVLDFHFSCLFVLTLAFLPLFQRHHLYHFCSNTSSEIVALTSSPLPWPIVFIRT